MYKPKFLYMMSGELDVPRHAHMYAPIYVYIYGHIYTYIYIYLSTSVLYLCVCMYMYVYINTIHATTCMYIHICREREGEKISRFLTVARDALVIIQASAWSLRLAMYTESTSS